MAPWLRRRSSRSVAQYRGWIETQQAGLATLQGARLETATELLRLADLAADRIERGIGVLAQDANALDAFRVANRAVARALRKRLEIETPSWRAFQLAFILLNLPSLADPRDPHRDTVDLLFFPTGGGKTEAYLGLAAFAMVLRRLRHPGEQGLAGAGVSVIMRYTLRLLTLDQLARAAGLVCALELEREEVVARYGEWPFEIGLWVGKAATPNILGKKGDRRSDSARTKVRHFKADPQSKPSPIPLENCPWCGTRFKPDSFTLLPHDDQPRELRIVCTNFECDFTRDRALPIVAVDEPLYRRLPAFVIATVDKFAALPWVGQAGALLGGAERADAQGFYGAAEPGRGTRLGAPLAPPDLIIQDELHLIAGPLGTMAGLYEATIEALCMREIDGRAVRPKIVASTATVRRAQNQIQALFARPLTQVFPPPGPDRRDSFFCPHDVGLGGPCATVPRDCFPGTESEGHDAEGVARAHGRRRARPPRRRRAQEPREPGRPLHDRARGISTACANWVGPAGSSRKRCRTPSSPMASASAWAKTADSSRTARASRKWWSSPRACLRIWWPRRAGASGLASMIGRSVWTAPSRPT